MNKLVLALGLLAASTSAGALQNEMYPTAEESAAAEQASSVAAEALTAAEAGDAAKQALIASLYEKGEGVALNYPEALRWYQAAAAQNNGTAMNNLGKMYERGQGVSKDPVEALKWYLLASARGGNDAADVATNRDAVIKLLTKKQVAEAQRLAAEWRPSK